MRQLLLNVRPNIAPTFDNFEPGSNGPLLAALQTQCTATDGSVLYVWGTPGSGRSHLLQAAVTAASHADTRGSAFYSASAAADIADTPGLLIAIDDADQLDAAGQAALFRCMVSAREQRRSLLIAGRMPPAALPLRDDVKSRIAQGLVFEIQPLDDAQKARMFNHHARERGLVLDDDIVSWLLRHGRRDVPWLLAVLDALDEASLTHGRRITLPLLRELLQGSLFDADTSSLPGSD